MNRRIFLQTIIGFFILSVTNVKAISYTYIRELKGIEKVTEFSYDVYEWKDNAVLQFEDNQVLIFGDSNPSPSDQTVGTDRSRYLNPDSLSRDLTIIVSMFFIMFSYIGYQLKNSLVLFSGFFTIIVFILTFLIQLPFIYFWLMVIITSIIISFIGVWNYIIEPYTNQ